MGKTLILVSIFLGVHSLSAEEESLSRAVPASKDSAPREQQVPDNHSQIIKLTNAGLAPTEVHMKREDGLLFFLNSTADSLATIEFNYHGKQKHCASGGLEIGTDGNVRSSRPLGPRDFVSVCFPDTGRYELTVQGLASKPQGVRAAILVE